MQYYDDNNNEQKRISIRPRTLVIAALFLAVIIAAASVFTTIYFDSYIKQSQQGETSLIKDSDMQKYERLEEVLRYIENNYIGDVDEQTMIDYAIKGLVSGSGDKYGTYFTAEETDEFFSQSEGKYVGIGVVVSIDQETQILTVAQVYKDTPAEKAGIMLGDIIYKVDGIDVIGMRSEEVVKMVKGEEGTEVVITVLRGEDEVEMPMLRADIVMDRAEWEMLDGNIAYIKLYEFNGNCSDLFHQGLEELLAQGAEGLILDLRNNPGGDKNIVVEIADTLLPKGPIITLIDKQGNKTIDNSDASFLGLPLVVLVNSLSASASELLSGAIQDYEGIGVIIGETTYGKGVAQGFEIWSDGAMLRTTTSQYLTPSGRCPQDVGIIPDIEVILDEEVTKNPQLLNSEEDNQMQEAIRIVKEIISGEYIVH